MIKTRIRLYEQSLLGLRREKLSWTPLKHTTAKQLKTKNISVQISCLFCAFLCMCLDGCFSVFLLTLNKSKNLKVILLTLNKSKIILLTLNKSKKLTAKLPWEKLDAYAFSFCLGHCLMSLTLHPGFPDL